MPILSLLIWIPAVAALLLAFVPKEQEEAIKWGALVAALAELVLSVWLVFQFEAPTAPALAFNEDQTWIPQFRVQLPPGYRRHRAVDDRCSRRCCRRSPSWRGTRRARRARARDHGPARRARRASSSSLLLLETGMMGVFAAADLFLFYVFWEIMLLPMALLIGIWGGRERRLYASVKFVLYTMFGSALDVRRRSYTAYLHSGQGGLPGTFEIAALAADPPLQTCRPNAQAWLFAAFALSFAIKVPMFPFHTWLPDAHVEAPTAGSVILAGVLLKMGTYGFLRFAIPFFPEGAQSTSRRLIMTLSAIGIVYGSLMCMVQTDIKKARRLQLGRPPRAS
jgi:NADH-quinone oxidoreductase subunit M